MKYVWGTVPVLGNAIGKLNDIATKIYANNKSIIS